MFGVVLVVEVDGYGYGVVVVDEYKGYDGD